MNVRDVLALFAYHDWADGRLLDAARALSADELARDLGSSHGSLRGTLVHMLWAEWIWLERWQGRSPRNVFNDAEATELGAIVERWNDVKQRRRGFLEALTEDHLPLTLSYQNLKGEVWAYPLVQQLQHVVNHSTYHRGQAATLLRQLGRVPPATDFLVFVDETGG